ncbi:MAG TPA: PaaI family thioesterase [Flavobacteriales bacterium]|nr:PaaI family thioesterase [Flavobacteriales bacterium]
MYWTLKVNWTNNKPMENKSLSEQMEMTHFNYPDKFGEWMGYAISSFNKEEFKAETSLEIRKDHLSPAGKVHGGVISGFFDFACGAAVFTTLKKGDFCSTVELKVNYLMPINLGDELLGKTEVVFRGRKICVVHGFIYKNREDKPAAMATATFNVKEGKE